MEVDHLELRDRDVVGQDGSELGAGAGVVTDRAGSLWLVKPAISTAASTTGTRVTAVAVLVAENVRRFTGPSVSAAGIGVAGTAPIRGVKVLSIPSATGVTEVHDTVAGVHGLREGGAGGSAEIALHRGPLLSLMFA